MADSPVRHDPHKFAAAGLQLRLPVDLVPMAQYSRLNNVIPVIEGQLETRPGVTSLFFFPVSLPLVLEDDGGSNWADRFVANRQLALADNLNSPGWADAITTALA